jgi:hypothetical protein
MPKLYLTNIISYYRARCSRAVGHITYGLTDFKRLRRKLNRRTDTNVWNDSSRSRLSSAFTVFTRSNGLSSKRSPSACKYPPPETSKKPSAEPGLTVTFPAVNLVLAVLALLQLRLCTGKKSVYIRASCAHNIILLPIIPLTNQESHRFFRHVTIDRFRSLSLATPPPPHHETSKSFTS